jgi:hypothetical protein
VAHVCRRAAENAAWIGPRSSTSTTSTTASSSTDPGRRQAVSRLQALGRGWGPSWG